MRDLNYGHTSNGIEKKKKPSTRRDLNPLPLCHKVCALPLCYTRCSLFSYFFWPCRPIAELMNCLSLKKKKNFLKPPVFFHNKQQKKASGEVFRIISVLIRSSLFQSYKSNKGWLLLKREKEEEREGRLKPLVEVSLVPQSQPK